MRTLKTKLAATTALLPLALLGITACTAPPAAEQPKKETASSLELTDVAGRTVELPAKIDRMIFGESRLSYASLLLNQKNPTENVVAWGNDLQSNAPDIYGKMLEQNPDIANIPKIGSVQKGDLNLEEILKLDPQVMFISLDAYKSGQANGSLDKLDAAGLKYLVTDFRQQPVENTEKSVEILGEVTGKQKEAKKFIDYYKKQIKDITKNAAKLSKDAPTTFIWRAPGLLNCCSTFAKSNFAAILAASGGNNLADTLTPNEQGSLTAEAVVNAQPEQVIATGGDWAAKKLNPESKVGFLPLGYTIDETTAQNGLKAIMEQPGFSALNANQNEQIHGIYHQLYDSPWNFIAFQQFAKWSHPEQYKNLDTKKTWKEFHKEFLPWQPSGTFFITLNK